MRKKSKNRFLKSVGYITLFLLLAFGAFFFYQGGETDTHEYPNSPNTINQPDEEEPGNNENQQPSSLVGKIRALSEQGKVLETPYVAGKTRFTAVKDSWGKPESSTEYSSNFYASYPDHDVTVGYRDDLVFDIRSFHSDLHTIHLKRIKDVMGTPDDVRFYKDKTHDQVILVYQVDSDYQLKWILPKPTDHEPNPVVDHVSIYTPPPTKGNKQKNNISEMSIDEKIGQMIFAGITGTEMNESTKALIHKYRVGGLIFYPENLRTVNQTVQLLNGIKSENAQIPLLLGVDQEGGRISRLPGDIIDLPTNQQIGAINNSKFSYEIGKLLGMELDAFGFNLDFAPVLDVNSNPNNPVIGDRSFGNDASVVSRLGTKTMEGIQSQGIISVIKHFPGHGDTSVDSHLELPTVNKSHGQLKELELIPFAHAIENGADVVMAAHILLPKIDSEYPASMSKPILTGILRGELGFDGVVITDDMTMGAITENFEIGRAAVQSVKAGSDIILVAHDYENVVSTFKALKAAVESGEISEERIDESVTRILQLKRKYDVRGEQIQAVNTNELNQTIRIVLETYMD